MKGRLVKVRGIVPLTLALTAGAAAAAGFFAPFPLSTEGMAGSAKDQGQSTVTVIGDTEFAPACYSGFRMCGA